LFLSQKCFGFFNKNKWLFWPFLYILTLKQGYFLRRSKQAANLVERNGGIWENKIRSLGILDLFVCNRGDTIQWRTPDKEVWPSPYTVVPNS
jgi:hypothetical protein